MARIIVPGKSAHPDFALPRQKPAGKVEIDWTHPLSQGLVSFVLMPSGVDVCRNIRGTRSGTVGITAIPGIGESGVFAAQNDYIEFAHTPNLEITGPLTIATQMATATGSTEARIVSKASADSASPNPYRLSFESTLNGLYFVRSGALAAYGAWQPSSSLISAGDVGVVAVAGGATTWTEPSFAFNGRVIGGTRLFSGSDSTPIGDGQPLRIGQWDTETGTLYLGFLALWNRRLSAPELRELTLRPYQLLRPANDPTFFLPSTAGTRKPYTLTKVAHPDFALPRRQPVGKVFVDWDNPLSRGLVLADISNGVNLVNNNKKVALSGVKTMTGSTAGRIYDGEAALSGYVDTSNFSGTIGPYTMLTIVARTATVSASEIASVVRATGDSTIMELNLGNGYGAVGDYDKPRLAAGSVNKALWVNGTKFTSVDPISLALNNQQFYTIVATDNNSGSWTFHRRLGGAVYDGEPVKMALFLQWNRILSDAEIRFLSKNPYSVFRPANDPTFFLGAAAAATTSFHGARVFPRSILNL